MLKTLTQEQVVAFYRANVHPLTARSRRKLAVWVEQQTPPGAEAAEAEADTSAGKGSMEAGPAPVEGEEEEGNEADDGGEPSSGDDAAAKAKEAKRQEALAELQAQLPAPVFVDDISAFRESLNLLPVIYRP